MKNPNPGLIVSRIKYNIREGQTIISMLDNLCNDYQRSVATANAQYHLEKARELRQIIKYYDTV